MFHAQSVSDLTGHVQDSGYINGVLASNVFIQAIEGPTATEIRSSWTSLIVSILSAGTFFGALIAGDLADMIGRKWTIIAGCVVYSAGVVIQMFAAQGLAVIVVGRLVAGFGVGFVSAIIILYMVSSGPKPRHCKTTFDTFLLQSEICPRKVRGAIVSCYQFAITIVSLSSFYIYKRFLRSGRVSHLPTNSLDAYYRATWVVWPVSMVRSD